MSKLLVVGAGNMGSALLGSLANEDYELFAMDTDEKKRKDLNHLQLTWLRNDDEIPKGAIIILAVKPALVQQVLSTLKIKEDSLLISVAAGVPLDSLNRWTQGNNISCIRAMPNTPFIIGKGMTVFCPGPGVTDDQIEVCRKVFLTGGAVFMVQNEELMHTVTAVSGSGPAYAFLFLQALEDAGVANGLSRPEARLLAGQTLAGASELLLEHKQSPQELINQVTSPGGTTIAGILAMKDLGFEKAVHAAVNSARDRSIELGK